MWKECWDCEDCWNNQMTMIQSCFGINQMKQWIKKWIVYKESGKNIKRVETLECSCSNWGNGIGT